MQTLPNGVRGRFRSQLEAVLDPMGAAARWRHQFSDPMTFTGIDGSTTILTGSAEGIRAIFSAPPETYAPLGAEQLSSVLGAGSLLVQSGGEHRAMRKVLMPPFHGQRMRVYGKHIHDLAVEQTRDFKPRTRFVAQELMHAISMQTIIQLVFGVTAPERVAEVMQRSAAFRRAISPWLMIPMMIPCLRREFWGLGPWAALQRAIRGMRGFLTEETRRCRVEPAERADILSLLVAARYDDGTALSDEAIFEQLRTLLLAGHSTTATALTWAFYFLSQEPQVLSRLRLELAALGPDPAPEAIAQAPYLEAVCNETLRIRPLVGSVGRRLKSPMHLLGHELPAGFTVGAFVLWAHTNPAVFPAPERFRPERFLMRSYSPFEFLPFGGGHRRCIGAALALYEMKLVIAALVRRFTFELCSHRPIPIMQRESLVPRIPIPMIVRPA